MVAAIDWGREHPSEEVPFQLRSRGGGIELGWEGVEGGTGKHDRVVTVGRGA